MHSRLTGGLFVPGVAAVSNIVCGSVILMWMDMCGLVADAKKEVLNL